MNQATLVSRRGGAHSVLVCLCADHFKITKVGKEVVGKPYGESAEGMAECKAGAQLL